MHRSPATAEATIGYGTAPNRGESFAFVRMTSSVRVLVEVSEAAPTAGGTSTRSPPPTATAVLPDFPSPEGASRAAGWAPAPRCLIHMHFCVRSLPFAGRRDPETRRRTFATFAIASRRGTGSGRADEHHGKPATLTRAPAPPVSQPELPRFKA
jgi:hypothetical protein